MLSALWIVDFSLFLYWRELVLAYRAKRTLEIVGKILEWCACRDASLWHSYSRVVHPTAYIAYILLHSSLFLGVYT